MKHTLTVVVENYGTTNTGHCTNVVKDDKTNVGELRDEAEDNS